MDYEDRETEIALQQLQEAAGKVINQALREARKTHDEDTLAATVALINNGELAVQVVVDFHDTAHIFVTGEDGEARKFCSLAMPQTKH